MRTLALLLFLAMTPAAEAANQRPQVLREVGIDQRLGGRLPLDLAFRDERGREVRLGDYFGERPVVLSFAWYGCPMLCPLVLNGMVTSLGVLSLDIGKDFDVLTVGIDPRETPALASEKKDLYTKRYARPGAAEAWHFLTGDAAAIESLTQAVGFRFVWDEKTEQWAHAAGVVVLTPEGEIARYFYGIEFSPRDLKLGLVEASSNRIGSLADQLLLFCYHYDPVTGTYGALAMGAVRVGALLTMLGLGTFLATGWRRERRGAAA